jgi:hypothetical protein
MLTLSLVIILPLRADIIRIPADQLTIQTGIDSTMTGDTVLVSDGVYFENIDFKGKPITVASHFLVDGDTSHISNTIINGSQPTSPHYSSTVAFSAGGDTSSVLCGFTITGGTGTYILDYQAMVGGGIIIMFSGCKIQYNKIINNSLEFYAGGGVAGAGIGANIDSTNVVIIENNIIQSNIGSGIWASGGGVLLHGKIIGGTNGDYRLLNNLIYDNILTASQESAGAGIRSSFSKLTMINNTIVSNNSRHFDGGLSLFGTKTDIINCIIWNNVSLNGTQITASNSNINVAYSNVQGGFEGEGNIDDNPEFVNPAGSDFRLTDLSPCIGSGIETVVIQGEQYKSPVVDITGKSRPLPAGSNPDIGAYESVLALPDSISLRSYIHPDNDTLLINALIQNSNNHKITVQTNIVNTDSTFVESVLLYDDGFHEDGHAGDNFLGGYLDPVNIESEFSVDLAIFDFDLDHTFINKDAIRFTSIGPIINDGYFDDELRIGVFSQRFVFKIRLGNMGRVATAKNIAARVKLLTEDSCFTMRDSYREYRDIEPGDIVDGTQYYSVNVDTNCLRGKSIYDVQFSLEIKSDGYVFWTDTFSIDILSDIVEEETTVPKKYALGQNYPNPFNPKTIINYELPITDDVDLSIYNLLGQKVATLVSEKKNAGHHQVEWDASGFASGVYYYRLSTSSGFVQTRKLVLIR